VELTEFNVHEKFLYCLQKMSENGRRGVRVEAISIRVTFDAVRLLEIRSNIKHALDQLPTGFTQSLGGGLSFTAMKFNRQFRIWSYNPRSQEELLALSMGLGLADFLVPRDVWHLLPGQTPFVVIKDR
jgi:hypothetical protein